MDPQDGGKTEKFNKTKKIVLINISYSSLICWFYLLCESSWWERKPFWILGLIGLS